MSIQRLSPGRSPFIGQISIITNGEINDVLKKHGHHAELEGRGGSIHKGQGVGGVGSDQSSGKVLQGRAMIDYNREGLETFQSLHLDRDRGGQLSQGEHANVDKFTDNWIRHASQRDSVRLKIGQTLIRGGRRERMGIIYMLGVCSYAPPACNTRSDPVAFYVEDKWDPVFVRWVDFTVAVDYVGL